MTLRQLEMQLGSPEQIAADFIDQMSPEEISRRMFIRGRVLAMIIAFIICVTTVFTVWGFAIAEAIKANEGGYYDETIYTYAIILNKESSF